jgi:unsaturated rhamnogalacturonyl hydrolase
MSLKQPQTPIQWAEATCDTMMNKFRAKDLPPAGRFHYHQGVFLLGMQKCWEQDKKQKYFEYIKAWVDGLIRPDGTIIQYDPGQMDDIQPGILLYELYGQTGDTRYKKALDTLIGDLVDFKHNQDGGLWHKANLPHQMWLDGLFMGGPITAKYAARFQNRQLFDKVALQAKLMYQHNLDPQTGLLLHGWDESRQASWANRETGRSPEVWGRALGWYVTAMVDILDYLPASHPDYPVLLHILKELAPRIVRCQDAADGRWYQVVNKGNRPGNWLENSCSCLFVYAITKAVRKGYIDRKYWENAKKGYQGVIRSIAVDENRNVRVGDVCIGTGIGDYDYYIKRPTGVNDLHGVGAFLIMCAEMNLA